MTGARLLEAGPGLRPALLGMLSSPSQTAWRSTSAVILESHGTCTHAPPLFQGVYMLLSVSTKREMAEPGSRATLRFRGLLLPQAPLMQARPEGGALENYRFDQLWRHTAGLRKHALQIGFSQQRLEGVMQV